MSRPFRENHKLLSSSLFYQVPAFYFSESKSDFTKYYQQSISFILMYSPMILGRSRSLIRWDPKPSYSRSLLYSFSPHFKQVSPSSRIWFQNVWMHELSCITENNKTVYFVTCCGTKTSAFFPKCWEATVPLSVSILFMNFSGRSPSSLKPLRIFVWLWSWHSGSMILCPALRFRITPA